MGGILQSRIRPLLNERVEAWKFGPVIPSLYHEFKNVGGGPIESHATELFIEENGDWKVLEPAIDRNLSTSPEEDVFAKDLVRRILRFYGKFTAEQLSQMTHAPGSPWWEIHEKYGDVKNVDIPDETIREYFVAQAASRRMHEPA